jgi:hypothetical protein
MLASKVTIPSLSGLAPKPTQQLISDSITITPFSTASIALPFVLRISHAAILALNPASQVEITTGLFTCRVGLNEINGTDAKIAEVKFKKFLLFMVSKLA